MGVVALRLDVEHVGKRFGSIRANLNSLFLLAILVITSRAVFASDPRAVGDLIARDLSIPGLGLAGHVGMWSDDKQVVEVLNEPRVIQVNSLSNFKSRSKYWHARYGKGTYFGRKLALDFAWDQRNYQPVYTSTAAFTEGKIIERRECIPTPFGACMWVIRKKTIRAKYRCDTFVNHSYKKKAGVTLADTTVLPRIVFYSMPNKR